MLANLPSLLQNLSPMASTVEYHNCPSCGVQPHNIYRPNHVAHAILSLLTFPLLGGWLWIWLIRAIGHDKTPRCAACGQSAGAAHRAEVKDWKAEARENRRIEKAYEKALGPKLGKTVVVKRGKLKGVKGKVVERADGVILLEDRRGNRKTFQANQF